MKKKCPNCSQFFQVKSLSQGKGNKIPLFLSCGHSICESCVTNIVKFEEPIECKICQQEMTISAADRAFLQLKKITLYKLFPVNSLLLGEITAQMLENSTGDPKKQEDDIYIDLKSLIKSTGISQAKCVECRQITTKACLHCKSNICNVCFVKSHKNFLMFKDHVLADIFETSLTFNCKKHKDKPLDYYCKDCNKPVCVVCLMVGGESSCKNHTAVSYQDVHEGFLQDLYDITPKVDETFRRLTKTAVDVGHLLNTIENESGSSCEVTQMLANVEQNFSKLMSVIQRHKTEVIDVLVKLKDADKDSLRKARADLIENLTKANEVVKTIRSTSDPVTAKLVNLAVVLEEAKQVLEIPWYLAKDESNDPLIVTVNDDLCSKVSDYIHLAGSASSEYKLRKTAELGPDVEIPPAPRSLIFPPELPKDVRVTQNTVQHPRQPLPLILTAPKYRSRSGSTTSLNSCDSNNSLKSSAPVYGDGFQRPTVQQSRPNVESHEPRPLKEGSQELMYITHIVNPHNFYVQRSCYQNIVKELIREFRNAASMPKPSLNHVAEGKMYLVLNRADNMWQRCRVVHINRERPTHPTILVLCVDFGSTETVTIDKLRLLPAARLMSPHPLAINCLLANCEPRLGAWTEEDAFLIQEIVDNKLAAVHVRSIHSTADRSSTTMMVDVVTLEDGVSLAHALAFHERARMPHPKQTVPKIMGIADTPKILINNGDFKSRSEDEVYLTVVVNPDKFFVRKRHVNTLFEKLCEELDQEYNAPENSGKVFLPRVGMSCVVHVEKLRSCLAGCEWARAIVQELPGRGRVGVFLPDCGINMLVDWSMLRYIKLKFTTMRALATECHLAGVTPLNKKWHPKSVELLRSYEERILTMHVDDTRRGSVGVTLYDHTDLDDIICINTEMIKYKFAVTFGIFNFNNKPVVEEQAYTNKSPLEERPPKKTNKPGITVLSRSKPVEQIIKANLDAKDKGPLRLEAKLLHYQSPSLLYVSLVHQQKAFSELFENIQKFYTSNKNITKKTSWEVGDRCCTTCAQSQTWRRAVVMEILPGNNAKVFYSDFACVETVPIESLCELTAEFATIGDAAIKCHLCGITPADGGDDWPSVTKEYLKDLLDAYQRLFITKLGNFEKKSMPVEVWVYHTIQGGALDPDISEWRCLNRKIVDQGLGVPDKTQQNTSEEPENNDMLSFLKNVTSSVDDWLQLEPLTTERDPSLGTPPPSDTDDDTVDKAVASGSSTVFLTDWLPPEPFANETFMGMPTYVDNNGLIYLHDMTQHDTLDLIRRALEKRFNVPDPKAKYQQWTVGEPCIAKFYLDNRFYRGRVVDVNNEDSNCVIHYVDYGNDELCSFENLRKGIKLHQIPIQAHMCTLARICPVGNRWDRNTMDYIHKQIVDKECLVKVMGDSINGITPIEIKCNKLCINDHLVDFEMAIYNDDTEGKISRTSPDLAEPLVEPISIESDSDPDYILGNSSHESIDYEYMKNKDWNDLLTDRLTPKGIMAVFPNNDLQEFMCKIDVINNATILELAVIHDDESNLLYDEMYAELQSQGEKMPPLDGIFLNKACVSFHHESNTWYRTTILQYNETDKQVKLRFVDYGNIQIVSLADVKEISPEFTMLPPATIPARLYALKVNPQVEIASLMQEYQSIFLDNEGPLHAKVIEYDDSVPCVELRNDDGKLVYDNLITKGVFIKCVPQ